MELKDEQLLSTPNDVQQQDKDTKPNAYRVDDDGNADEASLKRNYIIGGEMKDANAPGMEGEGTGGQQFGGTSNPPTGDDPANPSRNAGYSNGYFARTEPAQERPENNNFKSPEQQGQPDYKAPTSSTPDEDDKAEQQSEGEKDNTNHPGKADYKEEDQHGPDYGSNSPEIPGPNEMPEQQKVGGA
ncbi:hypothetical protein BDD43_5804 [Mucilaginibacter gracilis]|uniref:Uncharacterized protein n=1 Tax=Mucilaginibacter gracilis TaxID=423350 RepID=A0A495J9Q4_9SPHI|nr:hypothetical protein [Mucilaginibacter gracilis]RKR85533.1 hypothetical protein BDD43_5804 [Mucilaginibacter gracilis]